VRSECAAKAEFSPALAAALHPQSSVSRGPAVFTTLNATS